MHTLYPVNHLIKTTPESTLGLHFDSFKLQHQLLRNLKFYQLHFIWAPLQSSLLMQIFKALQLLKSTYSNGHISAGIEAATHFDALIQGLEDQKEGEDDIYSHLRQGPICNPSKGTSIIKG